MKGFPLLVALLSVTEMVSSTDPLLRCSETGAELVYNDLAFKALGVCPGDFLIINDEVTDDPDTVGDSCKYNYSAPLGDAVEVLSWNVSECEPSVTQDNDTICYTWYARNAELGVIKRVDGCLELKCCYPRKINVTSELIMANLTKSTGSPLQDSVTISLQLETFNSMARMTPVTLFYPPETIYARVSIIDDDVSDNFWVQIYQCWAVNELSDNPDPHYSIIEGGDAWSGMNSEKDNITVGLSESHQQDFSFNSFVWSGGSGASSPNQFWIHCKVFLCDSQAANCTIDQFPAWGRRRRAVVDDLQLHDVMYGPIHTIHRRR